MKEGVSLVGVSEDMPIYISGGEERWRESSSDVIHCVRHLAGTRKAEGTLSTSAPSGHRESHYKHVSRYANKSCNNHNKS